MIAMDITLGVFAYFAMGLLVLHLLSRRMHLLKDDDEYSMVVCIWPLILVYWGFHLVNRFITWLGGFVVKPR